MLQISSNSSNALSKTFDFSCLQWRRTPYHEFLMALAIRSSRTGHLSPILCHVPSGASTISYLRCLFVVRAHRHEAKSRPVETGPGKWTVPWPQAHLQAITKAGAQLVDAGLLHLFPPAVWTVWMIRLVPVRRVTRATLKVQLDELGFDGPHFSKGSPFSIYFKKLCGDVLVPVCLYLSLTGAILSKRVLAVRNSLQSKNRQVIRYR
jgi:hypothetical protein